MRILKDHNLTNRNGMRCKSTAKQAIFIESLKDLDKLDDFLSNDYLVLGSGYNTILPPELNQVVIVSKEFNHFSMQGDSILCSSNTMNYKIQKIVSELFMVPGTIGGSVFGNAGISKEGICKNVKKLVVYDNGIKEIGLKDFNPSYRKSGLSKSIILLVEIEKDKEFDIKKILVSKKNQPYGKKSCGCIFKNPEDKKAWKLISESGLVGLEKNGFVVSNKHCNFIINTIQGNDSKYLVEMIHDMKELVLDRTGYILEEEVRIIEG